MCKDYFVYTRGVAVPRDVKYVVVHHSVEVLPAGVFEGRRQLREVVLPEGLLRIEREALCLCESLEHVSLPSTLVAIGGYAFSSCTSLSDLDFPEGLLEMAEMAFFCCSFESIRLPSTLTAIGDKAFLNCTSLKVLILAESIETIGESAFYNCNSLGDLLLPATLAVIGRSAFGRCTSLRAVTLQRGVQMINERAFEECNSLENVTIPSKALVVAETGGIHKRLFLTDGSVPLTDRTHVVMTSECFHSLRPAEMPAAAREVAEILGRPSPWDEKHARLREWLASREVRRKKEVTTILELGLWNATMGDSDRADQRNREECRAGCGAGAIVPNILPFL